MKQRSKYEQYDCLAIIEQEKQALQRYISSRHIEINEILELNPDLILKQQKKGWHIDLTTESIMANLDDIQSIYAAMYKYFIAHPTSSYARVTRGTSENEVIQLRKNGKSSRFLSTTTDPEEAMKFTEYQNGAMITLNVGENVPHIPMDEFLGETQVSESEVLLAPFTIITGIQEHYHEADEVARYTVNVSRGEFKELTDEERKQVLSKLQGIDIQEYLRRLSELESEIDKLFALKNNPNMQSNMDLQDKMELDKKLQTLLDERTIVSTEFSEIKGALHSLIQDRLRQTELSIDRQIATEEMEKLEIHRQSEIERIGILKEQASGKVSKLIQDIAAMQESYFSRTEEQEELTALAEKYGIAIPDGATYSYEIEEKFKSLRENIEKIQITIDSIEVGADTTLEQLKESGIDKILNENIDSLEIVEALIPEVASSIDKEKQDLLHGIRSKISKKVTEEVKRKLYSRLNEKKQKLQESKVGFFARLTGKGKLKEEKTRNLELRMQKVGTLQITLPENIDEIDEYIVQIYAAAEGKECKMSTADIEWTKAVASDTLPIVTGKRMPSRRQTEILRKENQAMIMAYSSNSPTEVGNIDLPSELPAILDHAIFYTGDNKNIDQREMQKTLGSI